MGAYTIPDFCRTFGIGRTLTYELLASGELVARKVRNRTLIDRQAAEDWWDRQPRYRPEVQREVF